MSEPGDFPPYAAGVPAQSQPPRPPAPGHLVGQAEGVTVRSESDPYVQARLITILSFRLRLPGHPPPLEVELRGISLTGVVRDGDWVEVANQPSPTGMFSVSTATNLTTGVPVSVKGPKRVPGRIVALVVSLALLLFILAFVGVVLMSMLST